jgi:hypothetical protein
MTVIRSFLGGAFRLVSDTRGATAAVMGVIMATVLGFAGLGVETGLWFSQKREYQTAVDAAALSGAFQLAAQIPNICSGGATATNMTPIRQAGTTLATANGYNGPLAVGGSSLASTETLYVNSPPTSGAFSGNNCAVEAIIYEPKRSLFAAVYDPSVTIGVRSVALVKLNFGGGACDLSLNPNASAPSGNGGVAGINIAGTATVSQPGCVMASNSTNPCSFSTNGNPSVTIGDIYTAGGDCLGNNTTLNTNGLVPVTGGDQVPDPFASTFPNNPSMPSGSSCPSSTDIQNPTNTTIQPGTYKSIQLTSGGPYTLASGTYYICGSGNGATVGEFKSSVQVNTATNGATIIVQGKIDITGTGNMTAPSASSTATPYPGILFYQPGNGSNLQQDNINGGSNLILTGALYLPGGNLTFNGNNSTTGLKCLEIVSYTIQFSGTNSLSNLDCTAAGVQKINITNVVMAE